MTKGRQTLWRHNSPVQSQRRHNTSLRKKVLVRRLSGEVQFGASSKANLKVVVRLRPQNQREEEKGARCVVEVLDEHMLVFDPPENTGDGFFFKGARQRCRDISKRQPLEKKFAFERVFGGDSTNSEVYKATAHPLVDTLLQGYNCSVFAYGATGAGKTYTMLGRPECPGITSLTLQELYQRLEQLKGHKRCEVAVSYLEVYNETVRDLLGSGKPLALQETGQQVMVPGLSLHKPGSAEELLEMLAKGNASRTQHATDANAESSRSHAVFQIFVRQQDLDVGSKAAVTIAKLSMIDLAGSERGAATGFRGKRFKEGSSINKSLLALGNCINALADGQRHIPYRDSKLTRLLKDSLGGNCRSVMIAAMSPASTSFEDTYNTLRYAERAKTIKTTIRNNVKNVDQHVSDYIKVVASLREEVASLREKLEEYQKKEKEWEAQRSEMAAAAAVATPAAAAVAAATPAAVAATPPAAGAATPAAAAPPPAAGATPALAGTQQPSVLAQQEVEGPTANLKEEEYTSEEEAEAQRQVQDLSAEQKALRQELLQLEAAYKATELKRCHWLARHARVQVVVFASSKLEKTLHKCERTIHALDTRLGHMGQRLETVRTKLATNLHKMQEAREALSCFGRQSQGLVDRHETSVALRDGHQLGEHLQGLLQDTFKEHHKSEELVHVLLGGVVDLYLQLFQKEQCCPTVQGIFQRVVDGLDECRIAWADQQSVAEEGNQAPSGQQPVVTQLDIDHFTHLPSLSTPVISPIVVLQPTTSFRKSNLMTSFSTSVLPQLPLAADSRTCITITAPQPRPACLPPSPQQGRGASEPRPHHSPIPGALPGSTNTCPQKCAAGHPSQPTEEHSHHHPDLQRYFSPSVRPLNTTIDLPSATFIGTPAKTFPAAKVLNTTIDLHSPLILTSTSAMPQNPAAAPGSERLSLAFTDTKVLGVSGYQSNPIDVLPAAPSPATIAPVTNVLLVQSSSSTTTAVSGSAVARQLFSEDRAGLNQTFSVDQEESSACPPPTEPAREAPLRMSGAIGLKAVPVRSPLATFSNRTSHSNLRVPEKQPVKPQFIKGFRGMSKRRELSRTPHKFMMQSLTPGKSVGREGGLMRRSVSTSSLVSQPPSTTKRKLKGLGGTLHRTTSFLRPKTPNQENVPPPRTTR